MLEAVVTINERCNCMQQNCTERWGESEVWKMRGGDLVCGSVWRGYHLRGGLGTPQQWPDGFTRLYLELAVFA